jgi:DNA helicase-2/ATP-dependent DNA helicase PcrA
VLARVNAVLLPIQVVLLRSGIPCNRAVGTELLGRTVIAAALAYLRIGLAPDDIATGDLAATARRPSRQIARNVLEMMGRRPRSSVGELRRLGDWLSGDDASRVHAYADDLELVARTVQAPGATTAGALAVVRRRVGLDRAMNALDASRGSADRSAHGDDLWALEQVAALHPDPATFEPWLRETLSPPRAGDQDGGVHLATVHRVKGREWPRVLVFGASATLFPHRLADDVEEERRIFHVAITRAGQAAVVLAEADAPSPFIAELAGTAASTHAAAGGDGVPASRGGPSSVQRRGGPRGPGARRHEIVAADDDVGFQALRAWRTEVARRQNVPPYVVMSDAHLRGIAARRPATVDELASCPGIGPVKLDRYGDDILTVLGRSG